MIKRKPTYKHLLAGLSIAIVASTYPGLPPVSAAEQGSSGIPDGANDWFKEYMNTVNVTFENMRIYLPAQPTFSNNTIMVPAKSMLAGLGYGIQWDEKTGKMTATHSSRPELIFWKDRHDVKIGGKTTHASVAPYTQDQMLWIPLRITAEGIGLQVRWEATGRNASVIDPLAMPLFVVGTRADNNNDTQPVGLEQYIKSNWKMDVRLLPIRSDYYQEKSKTMIAAGDVPNLMLLINSHQFNDELLEAISVDITGLLAKYPRLQTLVDNDASARTINGRVYGIPRPADNHDAPFPALRQDWLDKLNLAQPTTLDELYLVLKAFVTLDPDGDGKSNTIGLTGNIHYGGLASFAWIEQAYTGNPDRYSVTNGKIVDHAVSKEEGQALEWIAKAYADGLIDPDFITNDPNSINDKIASGKVGAVALPFQRVVQLNGEESAQWTPLATIKATADSKPIAPWSVSGNGMYFVSSLSRANPNDLLKWLDQGLAMTEAGEWSKVEGLNKDDESAIRNFFGQSNLLEGNSTLAALPQSKREPLEQAVKSWREVSYEGKLVPQVEQLASSGKYAELNSEFEQMKVRVITGEATIAEWNSYVAKMTASESYKAMIKDLQALLN